MADAFIHKNLTDKGKEIQHRKPRARPGASRRDLAAIVATERVFQSKGPKVTAYMSKGMGA